MNLGTAQVLVKAKTDQYDKGIDRAERKIKGFGKESEKSLTKAETSFSGFSRSIVAGAGAIGVAFGAIEIVQFGRDVVDVGVKLDSLQRSYAAIFDSVEAAGEELDFVNDIAKKYGLSLPAVENAFKNIAAAAKDTALEGEEVRRIFESISVAGAALGMSADGIEGSLQAISQMISKGNVQAEELRGQLGERLPGAFQIAAKAMGVTTQELSKMLEQGEVLADDLLPRLADELQNRYGTAAVSAGESSRAAFQGLKNEILELKRAIAGSGITEWFADMAEGATLMLKQLRGLGPEVSKWLLYGGIKEPEPGKIISKPITNSESQYIDSWQKEKSGPKSLSDIEQQLSDDKIYSGLNSWFGESERMEEKFLSGIEALKRKQIELQEQFADEYNYATMTVFDYEREKVEEQFAFWSKTEVDKVRLKEMYAAQMQDISDRETADLEARVKGSLDNFFNDLESQSEDVSSDVIDRLKSIEAAARGVFRGMEDSLFDWVTTGKASISDFVSSVLKDFARLSIQESFTKPLTSFFSQDGGGGNFLSNLFSFLPSFDTGGMMGSDGQKKHFPAMIGEGEVSGYPDQLAKIYGSGSGRSLVVTNNINIESGSGGSNDAALANRIATTIEHKIRAVIQDEKRVGGSLNNSISGVVI